MLASRLHGVEDLRLDEIDDPDPGSGQVQLRVAHNGICGSDLHLYFGTPPAGVCPIVLGHEFAGVVNALGPGVSDLAIGDRVAVRPIDSCGDCHQCKSGHDHRCRVTRFIGCNVSGGGLAEHSVVPRATVVPLPKEVSLTHGALVEPMAVSLNGVLRSGIGPGATAVVLGGGPIGIGVLLGLRAIGVDDIVLVEPSAARRHAVEGLGAAADVLDPLAHDVAAAVRARTGGRGADAVFECAGVPATFSATLPLVASGGRVVLLAIYEQPVTFNPFEVLTREIDVVGSMAYAPGVFERVIDLMAAGHYPTDGWVEHIPWTEILTGGFEPLRRGARVKVLVDIAP